MPNYTAHRVFLHGDDPQGNRIILPDVRADPWKWLMERAVIPMARINATTGNPGILIVDMIRMKPSPPTPTRTYTIDNGHYNVYSQYSRLGIPACWDAIKRLAPMLKSIHPGNKVIQYTSIFGELVGNNITTADVTRSYAPKMPDTAGVAAVWDAEFRRLVEEAGIWGFALDSMSSNTKYLGAPQSQWQPCVPWWDAWLPWFEDRGIPMWGEQYVHDSAGMPDPIRKQRPCVILPNYLRNQMSNVAKAHIPNFDFRPFNPNQPNLLFLEECKQVQYGKPLPASMLADMMRFVGGIAVATWGWKADGHMDKWQIEHEKEVADLNTGLAA